MTHAMPLLPKLREVYARKFTIAVILVSLKFSMELNSPSLTLQKFTPTQQ